VTLDTFIAKMRELGYSKAGAEDLIWVASSPDDLTQAPFNLVPCGNELFRIFKPDGRDGYFAALGSDRLPFEGTLEEAYNYVYRDRLETRRRYFGSPE